jgi:hypothetical protein
MVTNTGDSFVPMAPVAPPPAKKRPPWLFIGIAVAVLVGVAVAAVFVLRDSGDDALDTAAAADVIDDISDRVEFPDESRSLQVDDRCQIDLDVVEDVSPDGVDTGRGDEVQNVFQLGDEDDPVLFSCLRFDDQDAEFFSGVLWGIAPDGDFEDYIDRTTETFTVDVDGDPVPFRGGTIIRYCLEPDDPSAGSSSCEADWTDGTIQVAVFGNEIDADEAEEWLRAALVGVVGELAELDADDFPTES